MCDETVVSQDSDFAECAMAADVESHTAVCKLDDFAVREIKQEALSVFKQVYH